jgi:hypothetical protein
MGNAKRELHHFDAALDITLGVGDRLAVFARQDIGKFVVVFGDQVEKFHQHAGPALRVGGRPFRLRRRGVLNRRANIGFGAERDGRAHRAVHGLENFRFPARRSRDILAADKMPVGDHRSLPEDLSLP